MKSPKKTDSTTLAGFSSEAIENFIALARVLKNVELRKHLEQGYQELSEPKPK